MKGLCEGKLLSVVTFVFLWAFCWGGDGDGVKHTTVLPGVVWITDALHLVTASLQDGEEKLLFTTSQNAKMLYKTYTKQTNNKISTWDWTAGADSPRGGSRCERARSPGRC